MALPTDSIHPVQALVLLQQYAYIIDESMLIWATCSRRNASPVNKWS